MKSKFDEYLRFLEMIYYHLSEDDKQAARLDINNLLSFLCENED